MTFVLIGLLFALVLTVDAAVFPRAALESWPVLLYILVLGLFERAGTRVRRAFKAGKTSAPWWFLTLTIAVTAFVIAVFGLTAGAYSPLFILVFALPAFIAVLVGAFALLVLLVELLCRALRRQHR
ncbi:hypothetical protein [Salininema proteolyticum]|uniref:DUF5668 domain-containing protein n=1 Tax=Salininema proteolyticum TaxID=1607685 RepID=A0ABV8TZF0_9ACTN